MSVNETMLSGAQCRAARALTEVSRSMLAERSGVSETDIRNFENRLAEPAADIRHSLRQALETLGAAFLFDDAAGGPGVRLKFDATEAARIDRLENEGGAVGEDDIRS